VVDFTFLAVFFLLAFFLEPLVGGISTSSICTQLMPTYCLIQGNAIIANNTPAT
jgi:hypothetical protein